MTRLYNSPEAFADELVDGFVAANHRWVRRVRGGVVRADAVRPGTVAVVVGGGSGHYPAFGGLVGPGLADGAAMGNLFASPSAQQVHSVARAAERGGGVLLSYGNYAGDVLQFGLAQERLRAEGLACETVVVTDDVASAPAGERDRRRGIAGDLFVFKAAGAAAAQGRPLDDVARVAAKANDRVRSFGVAFGGCTLPGADAPLFTVPEGRMAVGMGIHGEPGTDETDVPSADGLAELLVAKLLEEIPPGADGRRAAVVLNGLGSVKYEELFVVYRRVNQLLGRQGVEVVEPEVGELVTSFDMAGVSLTLAWLDDELEEAWRAPAASPAYRKVVAPSPAPDAVRIGTGRGEDTDTVPPASEESRAAAWTVLRALDTIHETVDAHAEELGRIDAVAGDGDHGIGMRRGAVAAQEAARDAADHGGGAGTVLARAADGWADRAGGTSGALWGVILRTVADELGDEHAPDPARVSAGIEKAAVKVAELGGARIGDRTMLDVLAPLSDTLADALRRGDDPVTAWEAAARVARERADATADLVPRMGRARLHTVRGRGTPDAGAASLALLAEALRDALRAATGHDRGGSRQ
ncbi:dihydroxyacetone kinase family protein [Nocardiopsis halotolerans]|uniref:dihydroxyacetone kinase family protein n=1 Tax=Nocardiopsis halotolerans TaxID=124252 RepID=UPI000349A42C|nr:dihydroxyacetone kinase family protein [Nocardiopsis halotolerans]